MAHILREIADPPPRATELIRALYTLLWLLALPLVPLRLWWRGRREPGYRARIGERFGRYDSRPPRPPVLWVHAVSLGETRAAAPLLARLTHAFPAATILLTHMTATGREAGRALDSRHIVQAWLPYDVPFAVRAFLAHFRPRAGLIMETELWPNLVAIAARAGVPLLLVNARLSERSAAGYARVAALARPMLGALSGIAAQSETDARRLAALGATDVIVTGNLKFDVAVPEAALTLGRALRARFGPGRAVWTAGSTRDGEEALILDAVAARPLPGNALTVLVPRHPQRFDAVAELLRARGVRYVRRSDDAPVSPEARVVLGDTMGELLGYYAAADVAFVGGSLLPLGGQNLIEPIAVGRPTLFGPHMFNFAEAARGALAAGAAVEVADATALLAEVATLLGDAVRRDTMRKAALAFHAAHAGALDRLWAWLEPQLASALDRPAPRSSD
jgi:3-deoxy-D-manno-octulosonic-acid transferase